MDKRITDEFLCHPHVKNKAGDVYSILEKIANEHLNISTNLSEIFNMTAKPTDQPNRHVLEMEADETNLNVWMYSTFVTAFIFIAGIILISIVVRWKVYHKAENIENIELNH